MAPKPTLTLEPDGTWSARVYLGTSPNGRRIRPYRRFPEAKSRKQAQALAKAWADDLTAHGHVKSQRMRDVLAERISNLEKAKASPHTLRTYQLYATRYVNPRLGSRLAPNISPQDIEALQDDLLERGGEGGTPLSVGTVLGVREMLSGVFKWLLKIGAIDTNPVALSASITPERREAKSLSGHDLKLLEDALQTAMASEDPAERAFGRGVWLALRTGLRVGEVCALRGADLRPLTQEVHVGGTVVEIDGVWRKPSPKSAKSCRNVAMTPADFAQVRSWQTEGPGTPLISEDGSWMRPSELSGWFRALKARLGLDQALTFHSLRHTYATTLLMAGADPKSVSEQMGHADVAITLRIYGHVIPGRGAQLASMASDAYKKMTRG